MSSKPIIQQFQDEVESVLEKYDDTGLTTGEAVGALMMVVMDLRDNQKEEEDEQDV